MKVITQSIICIRTGRVISEESYEYFGPVAECKSSEPVYTTPEQSDYEKRALQAQYQALQEATRLAKLGGQEAGIAIQQIKADLEDMGYTDVTNELEKLSMRAITGEEPVSPALERELSDKERVLRETAERKGLKWGGTARSKLESLLMSEHGLATEEARRNMIGLAVQSYLGSKGSDESKTFNKIASRAALPGLYTGTASGLTGVASGYGNLAGMYQQDRQLELAGLAGGYGLRQEVNKAKADKWQSLIQGIGGGFASAGKKGGGGGAAGGGGMA